MRKIVSTLGLGRPNQMNKGYEYERVRYCWGEREFETNLIQEAWGEWFPDAQVLVLTTEKAKQERQSDLELHPHWTVVGIPDGKNESELWGIYEQVVIHLEERDEVILDITHGFRSLPVVILLAASFLRSARGVTISHLLTTVGTSLLNNARSKGFIGEREILSYVNSDPKAASAETNSLLRIMQKDNEIVLLHSDTPEGSRSAELLARYYPQQGVACRLVRIAGLAYEAQGFANYGLKNFVRTLAGEMCRKGLFWSDFPEQDFALWEG
ncbi:MAG: CRISPR-associated DxTHG motif protein [Truepera sp.]|nr:CRISPR-associated DxTHG motif protein [Truepera sp.]